MVIVAGTGDGMKKKPAFQIESLSKSERGLLEAALAAAKATGKIVLIKTAAGCLRVEPTTKPGAR